MKVLGQSSGTRIELDPREVVDLAAKILKQGDWGNYPVKILIDFDGEVWTEPGTHCEPCHDKLLSTTTKENNGIN